MREVGFDCYANCNSNQDMIRAFELTANFNNLPSSKELKCHLHCCFVGIGIMNEDGTDFDFTDFFDIMAKLSDKEQDIFFKMYKGCTKQTRRITDPIEKVYVHQTCSKKNDNKV